MCQEASANRANFLLRSMGFGQAITTLWRLRRSIDTYLALESPTRSLIRADQIVCSCSSLDKNCVSRTCSGEKVRTLSCMRAIPLSPEMRRCTQ